MKTEVEFTIEGSSNLYTFARVVDVRKLVYFETKVHHAGIVDCIESVFGKLSYLKIGRVRII